MSSAISVEGTYFNHPVRLAWVTPEGRVTDKSVNIMDFVQDDHQVCEQRLEHEEEYALKLRTGLIEAVRFIEKQGWPAPKHLKDLLPESVWKFSKAGL